MTESAVFVFAVSSG